MTDKKSISMSQITTHILDTTKGKPVEGVRISFYQGANDEWTEIAWGITNANGRITDMLKTGETLQYGIYKLRFETKDYFDQHQVQTLYPYVEIIIDIQASAHYHIPLLLNPFGYTTYKGS
jgi:5-hydroxyisourate hydrolase